MHILPPLDIAALAFFLFAWGGYAVAVEWGPGNDAGSTPACTTIATSGCAARSHRELRMFDAQIMAALQNGTAFFASTSLIAIGGGLTMLRATNEINTRDIEPAGRRTADRGASGRSRRRASILIFVYAFFKFAWSYRLLQLCRDHARRDAAGERAHHAGGRAPRPAHDASSSNRPGRHFNRGQRAFFFALGYLGWFAGPWPLIRVDRRPSSS